MLNINEFLKEMGKLYNNEDTLRNEFITKAYNEDRPAFYTTNKYHNQLCGKFVMDIHMHSFQYALDHIQDYRKCSQEDIDNCVRSLIPINIKAGDVLNNYWNWKA